MSMLASRRAIVVAALALLSGVHSAHAQLEADPMPGDPRLVVFTFDENNSYRVFSKPLSVTHIVLEPDERLRVLALGDTGSWETSKKDNHVFVKPKRAGVSTSGTLITNKREYQFKFISTGEGGKWYQRVSFEYPGMMALAMQEEDRAELQAGTPPNAAPAARGARAEPLGDGDQSAEPGDRYVDPAQLNFKYELVGEAAFRPVNVYDNGRVTYIRLPEGSSVPALFTLVDEEPELVDYTYRGNGVLVVPRVLAAGMLKLGAKEVKFYNLLRTEKGFFGGYRERVNGR